MSRGRSALDDVKKKKKPLKMLKRQKYQRLTLIFNK